MLSHDVLLKQDPVDPKGTVSIALGTLGATIGGGMFYTKIAVAPPDAKEITLAHDTSTKYTVETTTAIDTPSALAIGATIGASAAVFGGVIGAIVVNLMKKCWKTDSPWRLFSSAILGAVVGAAVGFGVEALIGLVATKAKLPVGALIGAVTGGISGLVDSVAF